jgi:hypothetical protein
LHRIRGDLLNQDLVKLENVFFWHAYRLGKPFLNSPQRFWIRDENELVGSEYGDQW